MFDKKLIEDLEQIERSETFSGHDDSYRASRYIVLKFRLW